MDTQPEVQLRIFGRCHLPRKRVWKVFYDILKMLMSFSQRAQLLRMLCDSSSFYKQNLVKLGKQKGEFLVEYLFCMWSKAR